MHSSVDHLMHGFSYSRLQIVAAVLEHFVAKAPRAVRAERLIAEMEIAAPDVLSVCSSLRRMGLIVPAGNGGQWTLAGDPGQITLDDAWRTVLSDAQKLGSRLKNTGRPTPLKDVDLLIEQAILAIDQSTSAHLRRFQLDKVRTSKCGCLSIG